MIALAYLALVGWFIGFFLFRPARARQFFLFNFLGAWLFLPQFQVALPVLPDLTKFTASSVVALACVFLRDRKAFRRFKFSKFDLPLVVWCISPIFTSLLNGLGFWDGLSSSMDNLLVWGGPYLIARMYFNDIEAFRQILVGVGVAACVYLPFVWFEILISPSLHGILYGFDPGSWAQKLRYGGWRPQVFMQHGLMLAFFMAVSATVFLYIASLELRRKFFRVKSTWLAAIMVVTTVFCKSGNGVVILAAGIASFVLSRMNLVRIFLLCMIIAVPTYIFARTAGGWDGSDLVQLIASVADEQRAGSVRIRMAQENLFSARVAQRPIFGWGGWSRAFPVDEYGNRITRGVDALWIIIYGENGIVGLVSMFMILLLGPYLAVAKLHRYRLYDKNEMRIIYAATSIPVFFCIDSLMNAMLSPLYILIAGGLVSMHLQAKKAVRDARLAAMVPREIPGEAAKE